MANYLLIPLLVGKGFYSENVYLVKLDLEGKIIEAKIFMDINHAHSHLGEK